MTDADTRDWTAADGEVSVQEPPLPPRTRRPIDGLRLVLTAAVVVGVILLAVVAESSFSGLASDLAQLGAQIPNPLIDILETASGLAGLALPPVLVVILMLRGRIRTTIELLLAGSAAALAASAVSAWLTAQAPEQVQAALSHVASGGATETPVPPFPALLVAVVTVISRLDMTRINQVALFAIIGGFAVGLLEGMDTVPGTAVAIGVGRLVGLTVRLVSGMPSAAPGGREIAEILAGQGYDVRSVRADLVEEHRRYIVQTTQGELGVLVLDRNQEGAGMVGRLVDRLRTREEILPRQAATMRGALDHIALLSLAVSRAGARTPKLRDVLRLGAEAALIVHEHIPGRALAKLSADEVTDEMLADLWQQLRRMRRAQVAHRALSARTILVGEDDKVWLLNPAGGEVAAPDLALRTDLAQALVGVALVAGADRAVDSAVDVLGDEAVASAVPLLQPVALARYTRKAIRERNTVLGELRDAIVSEVGWEPEEAIRLERIRPLSLITGIGALVAVYLVGTQLTEVPFGELIASVEWGWVAVAAVAMAVSYVGAALALLGFVPERVPFVRTFAAQATLGFVRLVAPATVGVAAINIRLLTKAGLPGPLAAASIAASQVGAVAVTIPLVAVLGVVSGSSAPAGLEPSPPTLAIALGVLVAGGLLILVRPIRIRARRLWRDFAQRGLPRLLDVLSRPRKLAQAIGGILLQSLALVTCFYASVQAIGGNVDFAALAVVQLVGNAVGMAVPTPGGLGAVEAALTAGVTAIGLSTSVAVPAVLLFRVVSFWLPILPGWILWTQLQRREIL